MFDRKHAINISLTIYYYAFFCVHLAWDNMQNIRKAIQSSVLGPNEFMFLLFSPFHYLEFALIGNFSWLIIFR